jgi:hypothetical protein
MLTTKLYKRVVTQVKPTTYKASTCAFRKFSGGSDVYIDSVLSKQTVGVGIVIQNRNFDPILKYSIQVKNIVTNHHLPITNYQYKQKHVGCLIGMLFVLQKSARVLGTDVTFHVDDDLNQKMEYLLSYRGVLVDTLRDELTKYLRVSILSSYNISPRIKKNVYNLAKIGTNLWTDDSYIDDLHLVCDRRLSINVLMTR